MKTYLVFGEKEGLEQLVEQHAFDVSYRSKYLPLVQIKTEKTYEELREVFSEYTVSEPKEYRTQ